MLERFVTCRDGRIGRYRPHAGGLELDPAHPLARGAMGPAGYGLPPPLALPISDLFRAPLNAVPHVYYSR